ncbi:MAG: hypothetical protein D6798_10605 [Deltaproteobacteria bacterium]|nr:MAG: hypothetical protein D6798_10605 [Deltaproteobacteria bacterium]
MRDPRPDTATFLQACRDAGATDVEVLIVEGTEISMSADRNGRTRKEPAEVWEASVRVVDRRGAVGRVALTRRSRVDPGKVARRAMDRAAAASPDPDDGPAVRLDVPDRGLGILDPRLEVMDDDARVEVIESNLEGAEGAAEGIEPESFVYRERVLTRSFRSTRGVVATERSSRFELTGTVRDRRTGQVLTDAVDSRHFADVASVPLGVDLARRLAGYGVEAPLPTGNVALLLDPLAVARLLPALAPAFSGEAIEAGTSFLTGWIGQRVASSRLHILDDAAAPGALETRAFDDRGVPAMPIPLLREGVCGSTYLGPRLARRRNQRPTGHERADGSLWPGNLIVRSGTRSRNMLLPDLGAHVAIADFLDLSGVDLAAGTLDLPVMALAMDGPQVVGCAGPRRLQCAIPDLLSAVVHVCSDQERIRNVDACTWILEGIALG